MLAPADSRSEDVLVSALARCWPVARASMGFPAPRPAQRGNPRNLLTTSGARAMIVSCGSGP